MDAARAGVVSHGATQSRSDDGRPDDIRAPRLNVIERTILGLLFVWAILGPILTLRLGLAMPLYKLGFRSALFGPYLSLGFRLSPRAVVSADLRKRRDCRKCKQQ